MDMALALPVGGVLGSCIGCMTLIETLATKEPGCMNLMSFSFFLFIAIEGLLITSRFFTVRNKIPIPAYLKLVAIFFIVNVTNNQALNFHVPVPLHIIFRSGSLLASMVLGVWIQKRKYSTQKQFSVALISAGIIIVTLATGSKGKSAETDGLTDEHRFFFWSIGIAMLSFALVASAYLGITQEQLYTRYGKHPREALFYVHFLSLPLFGLIELWGSDISKYAIKFNGSAAMQLPLVGLEMPEMWVYLTLASLGQYACIRCVYMLTAECTALTVTLVVTLRKFLSLLISIWWFNNPFTALHWFGTALVFLGTGCFTEFWTPFSHKLIKKE